MKKYKCTYKHCQHETCEIPQDEAVRVGNRYMHTDCATNSIHIKKIIDLYYEKISKTVVMSTLVKTINNIVFGKGVDSGYLLFVLNHAIRMKIPIRSPYGLHYLIDNKKLKELWIRREGHKIEDIIKKEVQSENSNKVEFSYTPQINKGFSNILNGSG